jgi:hypothetical protein
VRIQLADIGRGESVLGGDNRGGKGRGGHNDNDSALSAGAYKTTWLVMVTYSPSVTVSKQDFKAWKQKYFFPLYIQR